MDGWWDSIMNFLSTTAVDFAIRLLGGLLLLVVGFRLIKWLDRRLRKSARFEKVDQGVFRFVLSFLSIMLKGILIVTVASIFGVPLTAIVTLLGTVGLAIGLAVQGSLSNFAGGMMILIFKPFKLGDYIHTPSGSGTVKDVSLFYTSLVADDHRMIVIPNGTISNAALTNHSAMPRRRIDLEFTVGAENRVEQVIAVTGGVAADNGMLLSDPAPVVRLVGQDGAKLTFLLRVWCKAEDFLAARLDLAESMKNRLDAEGIQAFAALVDVKTDQ